MLRAKKTSIKNFYSKNFKTITEDTNNSKYPLTAKALYQNVQKLDYIDKVVSAKNNNLYTSNVLLRVSIELYLVGHYIYQRYRVDESDEIGEFYYYYYFCQEFLKRENYNFMTQDSVDQVKGKRGLERIIEKYPQLSFVRNKDFEELNRKAKLFDVRNIIKDLNNDYNDEDFSPFHKIMLQLTEMYNETSSYVHGGPAAEMEILEFDKKKTAEEIIRIKEWSSGNSRNAKTNFLTFLGITDYPKYLVPVKEILEKK